MPDLGVQLIRSEAPAQHAKEMQNAVKNVLWAIMASVMALLRGGVFTLSGAYSGMARRKSSNVRGECRL